MKAKFILDTVVERRTQAERRHDSERAMLDATACLIAERGFAKTSLADIGELSGYSRGLVSHKFGSKEAIVKKLVEEIAEDTRHFTATEPVTGSYLEQLYTVMDRYLQGLASENPRSRAMFILMFESLTLVPNLRPSFDEITARFVDGLDRLLRKAKQNQEIDVDTNCLQAAAAIVANVRGVTMMWLLSDGSFKLKAARKEFQIVLRCRFRKSQAGAV